MMNNHNEVPYASGFVNALYKIPHWLDEKLMSSLVSDELVDLYTKFSALPAKLRDEDRFSYGMYVLDTIDVKTAALLTHVSMMIGVLSIVGALFFTGAVGQIIVLSELLVYIFVALGLLRCIRTRPNGWHALTDSECHSSLDREVCFRRRLYELGSNLTFIVTVCFVLTLIVRVLHGSFG